MFTLPWMEIDTVLLDMDGTLLDRYFDDDFWEEQVPRQFSLRHGVPLAQARERLYAQYRAAEGTLNWTDIDFWSAQLGLDISSMKEAMADRVRVHPGVIPFLTFLRREGKKIALATNAHPKTVAIKLNRTTLRDYFDAVLCSIDLGAPKEQAAFWVEAKRRVGFNEARTLFIDDTEAVLVAARTFGIRFLLYKADASSRVTSNGSGRFETIRHYDEMIPNLSSGAL